MALKDLTGIRFEKLLITHRAENKKDGTARWFCICDCGETRVIAGTGLRAGRHKSCGCSSPKFTAERSTIHGKAGSRVYIIWQGMRVRCSDKSYGKTRKNYFEKGIRVCSDWESFEKFYADMGDPPDGFTLERINGDAGYSKENCKWASKKEQANNTSANLPVSYGGQTKNVSQWAEEIGVKPNTLIYRLRRGIPVERAIKASIGHIGTQKMQLRERACEVCGKLFIPRASQINDGVGKFCSQKCNGKKRSQKE